MLKLSIGYFLFLLILMGTGQTVYAVDSCRSVFANELKLGTGHSKSRLEFDQLFRLIPAMEKFILASNRRHNLGKAPLARRRYELAMEQFLRIEYSNLPKGIRKIIDEISAEGKVPIFRSNVGTSVDPLTYRSERFADKRVLSMSKSAVAALEVSLVKSVVSESNVELIVYAWDGKDGFEFGDPMEVRLTPRRVSQMDARLRVVFDKSDTTEVARQAEELYQGRVDSSQSPRTIIWPFFMRHLKNLRIEIQSH